MGRAASTEEVGNGRRSQSLRWWWLAAIVAVGLALGACGAEEGATEMSTATLEMTPGRTEEALVTWKPTVTGDWLNIELEPLLRLQVQAAPVVAEEATVEPAVAAGQVLLPPPGGCPDVIVDTFGEQAGAACSIAWCESRWQPGAVGDHGASLGLFQIQPRWHQWRVPGEDLADPEVNVRAAYIISNGGRDWSAWSCRWVVTP